MCRCLCVVRCSLFVVVVGWFGMLVCCVLYVVLGGCVSFVVVCRLLIGVSCGSLLCIV